MINIPNIDDRVIEIQLYDKPDIVFNGLEIANQDGCHFVYVTNKGDFVCLIDDFIDKKACVAKTEKEIVNFFGFGVYAKHLYRKIGIDKDLYITDLSK